MMLHRGSSTSTSDSLNGTTACDNSRSSVQDDWGSDPVCVGPESSQMDIDDVPCASTTVPMPADCSLPQTQRRRSSSYNGRQSSLSGFRNSRAITFNSLDRRVQYKSFRSLRSVRPSRHLAAEWGEAHPRLYGHQNPGEMPDSDWESMDMYDDRAPLCPLSIPSNNMFHRKSKTEPKAPSPERIFEQSSMSAYASLDTAADRFDDEQASEPMCLDTSWDSGEQGQEVGRARAESLIRELSDEHWDAQDSLAHNEDTAIADQNNSDVVMTVNEDKCHLPALHQSIEHSEKFPAYEDPFTILGWRPPAFTLQPHFSAEHSVPVTSSAPFYDAHGISTGLYPSLWALRPASPSSRTIDSLSDESTQGWETDLQPWIQGPPSPIMEEPESPRGTVFTATQSQPVPQSSISRTTSHDTGEDQAMPSQQARNYQGQPHGQVPTASLRIPENAFVAKVLELDSPGASTIMRNRQSSVAKSGLGNAICQVAQLDDESKSRKRTITGHQVSAANAYIDEHSQDLDDPRTIRRSSAYCTGGADFRKDSHYSASDTFKLDKDRYTYSEPLYGMEEPQASFMPEPVIASIPESMNCEEEDHNSFASRLEILPLLTASLDQSTIVTQAGKVAQARRRSMAPSEQQCRNSEIQDRAATITTPGRRSLQDMSRALPIKTEKSPSSTVDLAVGETYVAVLGESAAYNGCDDMLDADVRPCLTEAVIQNLFRRQLHPPSGNEPCLGREISLKEVPKDVIPIRPLSQPARPVPLANSLSLPISPALSGQRLMNEEATRPTHLGSVTPLKTYTPVSSNLKTPVPTRDHDSPEHPSILHPEAYYIREMGSSAHIHSRTCERLRMQIMNGEICKSRLDVVEQGRLAGGKAREGVVRAARAFCGGFVEAARYVGGLSDFGWGNEFPRADVEIGGQRDRFQRDGDRGEKGERDLSDAGLVHAAGYV